MPYDNDDMHLREFPDAADQSPLDMTDTVPCPKCRKPVMEGSVCCPGCGRYMPWDEEPRLGWVMVVSLVVAGLLVVGGVWWLLQAVL